MPDRSTEYIRQDAMHVVRIQRLDTFSRKRRISLKAVDTTTIACRTRESCACVQSFYLGIPGIYSHFQLRATIAVGCISPSHLFKRIIKPCNEFPDVLAQFFFSHYFNVIANEYALGIATRTYTSGMHHQKFSQMDTAKTIF
jgi:hypothetical protein